MSAQLLFFSLFWLSVTVNSTGLISNRCWIKSPNSDETCIQEATSIWSNSLNHLVDCPVEGKYFTKWTCCADSFYHDQTGYTVRQCSGLSLKQEFEAIANEKINSRSNIKYKEKTVKRINNIIIREWIPPKTDKIQISISRKDSNVKEKSIVKRTPKMLYGNYIGDYIYYNVLSSILNDPLMAHFENEIEKVKKDFKQNAILTTYDWGHYYRQHWLNIQPFKPSTFDMNTLSVAHIQELSLIFWMDFIFLNTDRLELERSPYYLNHNNLMQYNDGKYWRIIPIDNFAMYQYIVSQKKKDVLNAQLQHIRKIFNTKDGGKHTLMHLCKQYFWPNTAYYILDDPKRADVLRKIVYNTWYNYGKEIADKIEHVLGIWTINTRARDDIFDDERHGFNHLYLKEVLRILKRMPSNIAGGNELEIGKIGRLEIDKMRNVLVKNILEEIEKDGWKQVFKKYVDGSVDKEESLHMDMNAYYVSMIMICSIFAMIFICVCFVIGVVFGIMCHCIDDNKYQNFSINRIFQ